MPAIHTPESMRQRLVRRNEMVPCKSAFIDTHTPGSHLKDNFSIIGPGVTENTEQVVNIREPHGFNIGAAGQPPRIKNSLHNHFTAEVFMIHEGSFEIYWGLQGENRVTLHEGDVVSIPTHCFRGFENVGADYGFLFTVLGGDDTGGVEWAPQVFEAAEAHGLVLLEEHGVWDTKQKPLPEGAKRVKTLTREEEAGYDNYSQAEMARQICYAGQRHPASGHPLQAGDFGPIQLYAMIASQNAAIPGGDGFVLLLHEAKPSGGYQAHTRPEKEVLICHRGQWQVDWSAEGQSGRFTLKTGDIFSLPGKVSRRLECVGSEKGYLFSVISGDALADPQWLSE
ncbi:MAG: cupin [SAR324 cluster bacterium]|jgi:mannose-6-phosphate isomerase-like protein (cupin superfamily)|nr:cupin [SAR324 cluster bacterium]MEC7416676.1 cupin [SAR324 cluster bacterium]